MEFFSLLAAPHPPGSCARFLTACRLAAWTSLLSLGAVACATKSPGSQPHDMSAQRHEQEAAAHAGMAEAEEAKYDSTRSGPEACLTKGHVCWTSAQNPTAGHLRAAEQHRRAAAEHRAASAALREAEATACAGISAEDRDMSPFERLEDIASVEALQEPTAGPKGVAAVRTAGAVITFRAVPGMTAEWLQRLVDCHLARNAALGHDVPEMPNCPLVPRGVETRVESSGNGFSVTIRSADDATAREILARAERLRAPGA